MSPTLRAGSLFDHLRHICERPKMFASGFSLDHLHLYIVGYDDALGDAGLPSISNHLDEWIYRQHPEWRGSSEWWARQLLSANSGDLEKTLSQIVALLDRFLETEGARFSRAPRPPRD